MKQFQINKTDINEIRVVDVPDNGPVGDGEICVRIEKFGFSANNVTYAVAGETLQYWKFFPVEGNDEWGILPVWGFAEIVESKAEGLEVGERLFGYFPPCETLVMAPASITPTDFFDNSVHRQELPRGYNLYRRVANEPGYNKAGDDLRMLLYPLYVTGFAIWDQLKEFEWYDAEQIIIISASSKTAIGLAYALKADPDAPEIVGLTSSRNIGFTSGLGIYDTVIDYAELEAATGLKPSAIVDMAGNGDVLGRLHMHLGDHLMKSLNVGLTHWQGERRDPRVIRDKVEFFFAPARIQKRIKEWGPREFNQKTAGFVMDASTKSMGWLKLERKTSFEELAELYPSVADGTADPQAGFLFEV